MLNRLIFGAEALLGPQSGVGTYGWALYRGITQQRPELRLERVASGRLLTEGAAKRPLAPASIRRLLHTIPGYARVRGLLIPYAPGSASRHWRRLSLRPPPGSLYHEPNFVLRPFAGPSVATIHDLAWLHYPQTLKPETRRIMEGGMPQTLARADLLLTVSAFVRNELIEQLGVAPERIRVTPNGVDARFHPRGPDETAAVLRRYQLSHGSYWLAVATPEPRKNLRALVQAFAGLPASLQARYPLVLVGGHGWDDALQAEAEPLQRRALLRRLGYVAEAELPALYAGAFGFALPSLYEGFGIPILEAMASGVPVLTSAVSALPEIAGDAALLVGPLDVSAINTGLRRFVEDEPLRQHAIAAGLQRARQFSWEHTVARTLAAYDSVMAWV